jgi:hypothetical protein
METDKIARILLLVSDLTSQNKLEWKPDNSGITYESFTTWVDDYKILIYTSALSSTMILYDKQNMELGRINESYWKIEESHIEDLIKKVKQQLNKPGEKLDDLFNKLNKK